MLLPEMRLQKYIQLSPKDFYENASHIDHTT